MSYFSNSSSTAFSLASLLLKEGSASMMGCPSVDRRICCLQQRVTSREGTGQETVSETCPAGKHASTALQHLHQQRQLWAQQQLQQNTDWSKKPKAAAAAAAAVAHLRACCSKPSATSQSLRMPSWKGDTTCTAVQAAAAAEARQGDASPGLAAHPAWRACLHRIACTIGGTQAHDQA